MIDFLLTHQYVQSEHCPHQVWQVVVGTGMGLNFSGELSDSAFYIMAEKWTIGSHHTLESAGVLGYWRFKDDILAAVKSDKFEPFRAWLEHMEVRAGSFRLEVETVSQNEVTFLDLCLRVQVHHGADSGENFTIGFAPHFMPRRLGRLSSDFQRTMRLDKSCS